jgi:hypothetical protein
MKQNRDVAKPISSRIHVRKKEIATACVLFSSIGIHIVFFFIEHPSFIGMVGQAEKAPVPRYVEVVAVHAAHEVWVEVDNNHTVMVGVPQGIFRPAAQTSPNSFIRYYIFSYY